MRSRKKRALRWRRGVGRLGLEEARHQHRGCVMSLGLVPLGMVGRGLGCGPDSGVPVRAVDCAGALHVMFYDNRKDTAVPAYQNSKADVYWMRLQWGMNSWTMLNQAKLTAKTFPLHPVTECGDFFSFAVGGETKRRLYPVYVARKETSPGVWSDNRVFTHKITVNNCPSGMNGLTYTEDSVPELLDAIAADMYPEGDLNGDDAVDAGDLDQLTTWVEGQNP